MLIRKSEITQLSSDIRKIIDGKTVDIRDNREGVWCTLKNDIHTLASLKGEQADALGRERDSLADTLADISHQLKTPLTSMTLMVDLLEYAPPNKKAEFISTIRSEVTHMEWLVSTLLKMAKLDAGAINFSIETTKVNELVNIALEPLQILLEMKNQQVEISVDTELNCDRRWTAEALTNIIKNASEYSPPHSTIRIVSGMNPICTWISVSDSGTGISYNEIGTLFKRYKGTRSDKGYGIGLPLSLAIMQSQSGDVEVDGGGNGEGATFILKFFK